MAWPRLFSAIRHLLKCVQEGLICLGQSIGPPYDMNAALAETAHADREAWPEPAGKPLTEGEHAEWAALVKRLG
jgi:hypothetical protein